MKIISKIIAVASICILTMTLHARAQSEQKDVRLSFVKLAEWQEKVFKGHTLYSTIQDSGKTVLQADAVGTASALYKKVSIDPAELPVISWSWKVKQAIAVDKPYRKDVDDFVARVCVIFPGTFFWQYKALAYVWSDTLPVGTIVPSVFGKNIALIVVESGNQNAGTWRHERRNYAKDYQGFFNTPPPNTLAFAVMTDSDNTKSEAMAWYDDIVLTKEVEQKK